MDLVAHLSRQRRFALETFGPGLRDAALAAHIRKELVEVAEATDHPHAAEEWVDVVILASEAALRRLEAAGAEDPAAALAELLAQKMAANEARRWPDWRAVPPGAPVEHVRD